MNRLLPFVIILAVLSVALGVGYYQTRPKAPAPGASPSPATQPTKASPSPVPTISSSANPGAQPPHAHGPENAPVTLEEFGDFECPPCGLFHPVVQAMEKEYGQRLRFIFRQFPLTQTHKHALAAARASEAAGLQGKFWEMHDLLYDNQATWHEATDIAPIFEGYAKNIGLDLERFRRDVASQIVAQRIFLDGKRAYDLGVKGTPTVFMNGREVQFESLAPDKLKALINAELGKSQ